MASAANPEIILPAPVARPLQAESADEKQYDLNDDTHSVDKSGLDEAGVFLRTVNVDVDAVIANATESDFARVRRKIDWRVLPLLYFTYALQNIDKSTLGYASVFTFQTDLGLVGKQYSWLASLFYFGYLICEYPTTLLSQMFPIGKFVGAAIFIWGGILTAAAGAQGFAGMAALRFLLGACESLITPTFVLINGMYYTRQEQALRTGIWASANGFGQIAGGLISYGVAQIDVRGIPGWKWIYIINGIITCLWGITVFLLLPSSPMKANFLTDEEKVLIIHRIRANGTGIISRKRKWYQTWEALNPWKDPQGTLLFLTIFCNEILNGSFGAFSGLTIRSFGFDGLQTTLIQLPMGLVNMICISGGGYLTMKIPSSRIYVAMAMLVPTFIGLLLQIVLPRSNIAGLLTGVYLFPPYATSLFICLALPGVNSSGYSKRLTLSSYAFLGYAGGNIAGPFTIKNGETPAFRSVFIACIICIALQGVFLGVLRLNYVLANRKRDEALAQGQVQNDPRDEFADKTDKELPGFRYVL